MSSSILSKSFRLGVLLTLKPTRRTTKKLVSCDLSCLYLFCLLASTSADIEPNPGPAGGISQYPCGKCNANVSWTEKGIAYDTCEQWFHIWCQEIRD
ncbi:hypothetical protein DPMN_174466 [Dreissena polymorpha]|uniref:PHD-type domain-containing protein n=1 Tax=Dreissena polymorpha TaxID=45954 RepID=A0A9D4E6F1_DREPO|nr:hypothetical protein DPMN_174466 [Dreissena polymorpha]